MTKTQFKITWKRAGNAPKSKIVYGLKWANHVVTILGPEPWRAHGQQPDDLFCCSGRECGCGGGTVREHWESGREGLPPLEWIKVEKRTVAYSEWSPVSEQTITSQIEARAYVTAHPEKYPYPAEG